MVDHMVRNVDTVIHHGRGVAMGAITTLTEDGDQAGTLEDGIADGGHEVDPRSEEQGVVGMEAKTQETHHLQAHQRTTGMRNRKAHTLQTDGGGVDAARETVTTHSRSIRDHN